MAEEEALGELGFELRRALLRLHFDALGNARPDAGWLSVFAVLVIALAALAADAALIFHQPGEHAGAWILLVVLLIEFGVGLADLQRRIEADRVGDFKRTHRHAALTTDVLDDRRRDAFHQHLDAFGRIGAEAARGVEAPEVIHGDRRLADLDDVINRLGLRFRRRFLAHDQLDEAHALNRREEVNANEVLRALGGFGEASNWQRRSIRAEHGILTEKGLGLLGHVGFQLHVFEDRFDDEVSALDQ